MTAPIPMPRKLGPGVLSVGEAGTSVDFSKRCKSAAVKWGVKQEDDTPMLDGSTQAGDRTYTATLEAKVQQEDLVDGSFVVWSWANKGGQFPATFTPYNGQMSIVGDVIVDPLDVGGDVGQKNDADIKWAFVGEPELVDDL